MLARKTKRISIPFSGYLSAQRFYLNFGDNVMGLAFFRTARLLQCANVLHLKAAIAFNYQPYWFGLLVLAGKVYL